MNLKYKHTLILVDDEPSILKALKRLFRRDGYQILTASGGQEALTLLKQYEEPVSLIISDQRMPEMNGATFLAESIGICPHATRFLLTGYSDMDAVIDAVNKGSIHKYIAKPWNDAEMVLLVREALSQVELKLENIRLTELNRQQNKELVDLNKNLEEKVNERTWALKYQNKMLEHANRDLERTIFDTMRLLLSLVESTNPKLGSYMKAVGKLGRKIAIAAGLNEESQNLVEMAGLVHDIGLLGMPDSLLEKDEQSMTVDEFETYTHHPEIAALCLSSVEGIKKISQIVAAHHENIDGSGFPNRMKGGELPKEARILSVAADYCAVLHLWPKGVKRLLAIARRYLNHETVSMIELVNEHEVRRSIAENLIIEGGGKRYDGAIVRYFLKSIGSSPIKNTTNKLAINLLKEGMIIAEDLRLKDGRLLLTRGTRLSKGALKSINTIGSQGMIEGNILITMPQQCR